jgi:hypothetical protein
VLGELRQIPTVAPLLDSGTEVAGRVVESMAVQVQCCRKVSLVPFHSNPLKGHYCRQSTHLVVVASHLLSCLQPETLNPKP